MFEGELKAAKARGVFPNARLSFEIDESGRAEGGSAQG